MYTGPAIRGEQGHHEWGDRPTQGPETEGAPLLLLCNVMHNVLDREMKGTAPCRTLARRGGGFSHAR